MDKHKGGDFYLCTSATETYLLKPGKDPKGFADFHMVRMRTLEITVLGLIASTTIADLEPVIFVEACWQRKCLSGKYE